jgi:hypothetical protein
MTSVFISYSRSDADFVQRLIDFLKACSIDYWLDTDRIPVGSDWSDEVWAALQRCDLMILVLSPASMISKEVASEWKYYHSVNKPIIPVLVDAATNIHYQLVALNYVDFARNPFEEAARLLETELRRVIDDLENPTNFAPEATIPTHPLARHPDKPESTKNIDAPLVDYPISDHTTARISRDLAQQLEERLHYFNEEMVLELVLYDQRDRRVETRIQRGRDYVIGRAGNGIVPDLDLTPLGAANQGISRKHALLRLDGNTLFIRDLHSTNYTYVEGKRLRGDEQLALKSGDRIQMGNLLFIVYFRDKK